MDPVSAIGSAAAVALFGLVKKYTGALDGKLGTVLKPLQPFLAMAAGIGLPYATAALGVTTPVDPAALVAAPLTTVVLVSTREAWSRWFKGKGSPQ